MEMLHSKDRERKFSIPAFGTMDVDVPRPFLYRPLINPLNSIAPVFEGEAGAQRSHGAEPLERATRVGPELLALWSHRQCLFL